MFFFVCLFLTLSLLLLSSWSELLYNNITEYHIFNHEDDTAEEVNTRHWSNDCNISFPRESHHIQILIYIVHNVVFFLSLNLVYYSFCFPLWTALYIFGASFISAPFFVTFVWPSFTNARMCYADAIWHITLPSCICLIFNKCVGLRSAETVI